MADFVCFPRLRSGQALRFGSGQAGQGAPPTDKFCGIYIYGSFHQDKVHVLTMAREGRIELSVELRYNKMHLYLVKDGL
jgi:hypothetical protein